MSVLKNSDIGTFLVLFVGFLSDPGNTGVQSLGPDVTNKLLEVV